MKPARGELQKKTVIIKNNKDIGRLFQKGKFGKPQPNNTLKLSIIESLFLIEERKLNVYKNREKISFEELISYIPTFKQNTEEIYIAFRDLRKRGIQIQISKDKYFTFSIEKKDDNTQEKRTYFIKVFSEREIPSLHNLKTLINRAKKKDGGLWLAIVDEEGDITYYSLRICTPKGVNKNNSYEPIEGLLLENRVVVFNNIISDQLYKNEFFGKPFAEGLQLSLVETLYLMDRDILHCKQSTNNQTHSIQSFQKYISNKQHDILQRYQVFSDLKSNGLVVKTGFKFGTHFRAYQKSPFHSHAEYLIHTIDETYETQWSEISRAVRLAHAVNKTLLFALIYQEREKPVYLTIQRLRP